MKLKSSYINPEHKKALEELEKYLSDLADQRITAQQAEDKDEIFGSQSERTFKYLLDDEGNVIGLKIYKFRNKLALRPDQILVFKDTLKYLDLSYNQIRDILPFKKMKSLEELNISGGLLSWGNISNISPLKDLTNLQKLDLSANQISDISPLEKLTKLTKLDLGWNNKISDISPLEKLTNLTELNLGGNQISDISPLEKLTNLTELNLGGNQISDICALERLTNLTVLNLSKNQISDISPLEKLIKLKYCFLGHNNIKRLPEWIVDREWFAPDDLNDNPLEYPPLEVVEQGREAVKQWFLGKKNIIDYLRRYGEKVLNPENEIIHFQVENTIRYAEDTEGNIIGIAAVKFSFIEELVEGIRTLKTLKYLELSRNRLNDISFLSEQTELVELSLNENSITDLSPLANLKKLKRLYLDHNSIRSLVPLRGLKNLQALSLKSNVVRDVTPLKYLQKIRYLDISNNLIKDLSPIVGLLRSPDLNYFNASANHTTLRRPPHEIAKQGKQAIVRWFDLQEKTQVPLLEAKLIVIGDGCVGKTSIIRKLLNINSHLPNLDERTISIDLYDWYPFKKDSKVEDKRLKQFRFNIWDFGGQGKYRHIQQIFCTNRSLYIYVDAPYQDEVMTVCPKNERYSGFDYWLNFVKAFAIFKDEDRGDQYSPLIYVQNKIDVETIDFPENLRKKYPYISSHKISCKEIDKNNVYYHKFVAFVEDIKQSIPKISYDILTRKYPETWIKVKNYLEKLKKIKTTSKKAKNYIEYEEFIQIFKKFNPITEYQDEKDYKDNIEEDAKIWLNVLDNIGTIIYFPDIVSFSHKIILNPDWLRDAIQRALDYPPAMKNGYFTQDDFRKIWSDYRSSNYAGFVDVMKKFEIVYEADKRYYVPALFDDNSKGFENYEGFMRFAIKFTGFMPAGIIWRLIVKNHRYIKDNRVWQSGFVFEQGTVLAEVKEDWKKRVVYINLKGDKEFKVRDLIISQIKSITQELEQTKNLHEIKFSTKVLCNCKVCATSEEPEEYNLGIRYAICPRSNEIFVLGNVKSYYNNKIKIDEDNNVFIIDNNKELLVLNLEELNLYKQKLDKDIYNYLDEKFNQLREGQQDILEKISTFSDLENTIKVWGEKVDELSSLDISALLSEVNEINAKLNDIDVGMSEAIYTLADEVFAYIDESLSSDKLADNIKNELLPLINKGKSSSSPVKFSFSISLLKLLDLTGIPVGSALEMIFDNTSIGVDVKKLIEKMFKKEAR